MKKSRFFAFLIALVMLLSSCGAVATHEHTFSGEWSHDENKHWHSATCEHTDTVSGFGAHIFSLSGVCRTCGYESQKSPDTDMYQYTHSEKTSVTLYYNGGEQAVRDGYIYLNYNCSEKSTEKVSIPSDSSQGYNVFSNIPYRDGYNFAGWYLDSALTKKLTGNNVPVTSGSTLYAKWDDCSANGHQCMLTRLSRSIDLTTGLKDDRREVFLYINIPDNAKTIFCTTNLVLALKNSGNLAGGIYYNKNGKRNRVHSFNEGFSSFYATAADADFLEISFTYFDGGATTATFNYNFMITECAEQKVYAANDSKVIEIDYGSKIYFPIPTREGYFLYGWSDGEKTWKNGGSWTFTGSTCDLVAIWVSDELDIIPHGNIICQKRKESSLGMTI